MRHMPILSAKGAGRGAAASAASASFASAASAAWGSPCTVQLGIGPCLGNILTGLCMGFALTGTWSKKFLARIQGPQGEHGATEPPGSTPGPPAVPFAGAGQAETWIFASQGKPKSLRAHGHAPAHCPHEQSDARTSAPSGASPAKAFSWGKMEDARRCTQIHLAPAPSLHGAFATFMRRANTNRLTTDAVGSAT